MPLNSRYSRILPCCIFHADHWLYKMVGVAVLKHYTVSYIYQTNIVVSL